MSMMTGNLKAGTAAISTPPAAPPPPAPTEQVEVPEYQFHPLAETFPLMSGDELKEFTEDIRKNGMRRGSISKALKASLSLRYRIEDVEQIPS
jgi:hypothetical protein